MRTIFLHKHDNVNSVIEESFNYILCKLQALQNVACNDLTKQFIVNDYVIKLIDKEQYDVLVENCKSASKLVQKHGLDSFRASEFVQIFTENDVIIDFTSNGASLSLPLHNKINGLCLDFEAVQYRQRLLRGGRQKEAVARAVLQGIEEDALVFDATAGLGRESMILAHAKSNVLAFERQLPIWIILYDALNRASHSRFFPFNLPKLHDVGTIRDYQLSTEQVRPEVIYYDPMFPHRESSAQVKKDMFIFQQVIGQDLDSVDFLSFALTLANKRVVVKRPSFAPPIEDEQLGIKRSYFVDGGQCRFDCYSI